MEPDTINRYPRKNKALAGFVLIALGAVFLVRQFDFFFFPHWLFTFPTFLIAIGLFIGARSNFRSPAWFILVSIGSFFLLDRILPFANFAHTFWPLIIIVFGLRMIFSKNRSWSDRRKVVGVDWEPTGFTNPGEPLTGQEKTYTPPINDDYVDSLSIFGGTKKTVLSKNFQGGDVVNIFGGSEIDLTQADINGRVIIDVTQIFGGIKLIVPPHWRIANEMIVVFGGLDDKRRTIGDPVNDKILVIKGVSMFAGVSIRSF